jgi:hypothetical protein
VDLPDVPGQPAAPDVGGPDAEISQRAGEMPLVPRGGLQDSQGAAERGMGLAVGGQERDLRVDLPRAQQPLPFLVARASLLSPGGAASLRLA